MGYKIKKGWTLKLKIQILSVRFSSFNHNSFATACIVYDISNKVTRFSNVWNCEFPFT